MSQGTVRRRDRGQWRPHLGRRANRAVEHLKATAPSGGSPPNQQLVQWLHDARGSGVGALTPLLGALLEVARAAAQWYLRDLPSAFDDAGDVAQEVVIRIAERLHQCRASTDGELVSWTVSITRRAVADLTRSPTFKNERSQATPAEQVAGKLELAAFHDWRDQNALARLADPPPTDNVGLLEPWTHATHELGRHVVSQAARIAYGALSTGKQQLIQAHLVETARWREVGIQLGITPSAAKRRYQRALAELQRGILRVVAGLPDDDRRAAAHVLRSWGVELDSRRSGDRSGTRRPYPPEGPTSGPRADPRVSAKPSDSGQPCRVSGAQLNPTATARRRRPP